MALSIGQPWIDLAQTEARDVSRNQLAAIVLDTLILTLQQFSQTGLSAFLDEWHSLDRYLNKLVVLQQGDKTLTGIARGVDASGALLLELPQGIQRYFSGEVQVRKGEFV
jgi:BirA family transcriptional regulator, biotin operon repressor / biotin---[acetyl-CoA-carboxylase] ligase